MNKFSQLTTHHSQKLINLKHKHVSELFKSSMAQFDEE